jgi:aspartate-semialdehyde dehydrogenase
MSTSCDVAIVGATGIVGEALLAILEERGFPLAELYLLASARSAGGSREYKGRHYRIEELGGFDFSRAQVAFFAVPSAVSREHVPRAVAAGCVAIDCSSAFRYEPDVPLVIPEVNPQAIAFFSERRIIASPDPATIQMLVALKPLYDAVGIERIHVCIGEAVSGYGKAAIEELAGQSAALLNGQSIEPQIFPRQIAFNCLPRIDVLLDNGYTENEMDVVWATRRILADDAIQVNPTAYLMPVFFGYCTVLHVETSRSLDAAGARRLLEKAPGVVVMDGRKPGDYPSPIGAVGTDSVYVGCIREDVSPARGLNMWVVADNSRKGSAKNAVQIAEVFVKAYL